MAVLPTQAGKVPTPGQSLVGGASIGAYNPVTQDFGTGSAAPVAPPPVTPPPAAKPPSAPAAPATKAVVQTVYNPITQDFSTGTPVKVVPGGQVSITDLVAAGIPLAQAINVANATNVPLGAAPVAPQTAPAPSQVAPSGTTVITPGSSIAAPTPAQAAVITAAISSGKPISAVDIAASQGRVTVAPLSPTQVQLSSGTILDKSVFNNQYKQLGDGSYILTAQFNTLPADQQSVVLSSKQNSLQALTIYQDQLAIKSQAVAQATLNEIAQAKGLSPTDTKGLLQAGVDASSIVRAGTSPEVVNAAISSIQASYQKAIGLGEIDPLTGLVNPSIMTDGKLSQSEIKDILGTAGYNAAAQAIQAQQIALQQQQSAQAVVQEIAKTKGVDPQNLLALANLGVDKATVNRAYPGNETTVDKIYTISSTLKGNVTATSHSPYINLDGSVNVINALQAGIVTPAQLTDPSVGYSSTYVKAINTLVQNGAVMKDDNGNWQIDPYKAMYIPQITAKGVDPSAYPTQLLKDAGYNSQQIDEVKADLQKMPLVQQQLVATQGITGLQKAVASGTVPLSSNILNPSVALSDISTLTGNITTKVANWGQQQTTGIWSAKPLGASGGTVADAARVVESAAVGLLAGVVSLVPLAAQLIGVQGLSGVKSAGLSIVKLPVSTYQTISAGLQPFASPEALGGAIAGLVSVALIFDPVKNATMRVTTWLSPHGITPELIGKEASTGRIPISGYDPVELGQAMAEASKAAMDPTTPSLVKVPIGETGDDLLVNKTPLQQGVGNILFHGSGSGLDFVKEGDGTLTSGEAGLYTNPWAALHYADPKGGVVMAITDSKLLTDAPTQVLSTISQSDSFIRGADQGLYTQSKIWHGDFETEVVAAPGTKFEVPPPNADLLTRLTTGDFSDFTVYHNGNYLPMKVVVDRALLDSGKLPKIPTAADLYTAKLQIVQDTLKDLKKAVTHPELAISDIIKGVAGSIKHPEELLRGSGTATDLSIPGVRDIYLETSWANRLKGTANDLWSSIRGDVEEQADQTGAKVGTKEYEDIVDRNAERYYTNEVGKLLRTYGDLATQYGVDSAIKQKFEDLYLANTSLTMEALAKSSILATQALRDIVQGTLSSGQEVSATPSSIEEQISSEKPISSKEGVSEVSTPSTTSREGETLVSSPPTSSISTRSPLEESRESTTSSRELPSTESTRLPSERVVSSPPPREVVSSGREVVSPPTEVITPPPEQIVPLPTYREEETIHPPTEPPPPPTRGSSSSDDSEKKALQEAFSGGVVWKQGKVYWVGKPPFTSVEDWHAFGKKNLPPGVQIVEGGPKSAYKSIQALGYDVPHGLTLRLGFQRITLSDPEIRPGKTGAIGYKSRKGQPDTAAVNLRYRRRKGKKRETLPTAEVSGWLWG